MDVPEQNVAEKKSEARSSAPSDANRDKRAIAAHAIKLRKRRAHRRKLKSSNANG